MKVIAKALLSPPWVTVPKFQLGQLICYLYKVDDDIDLARHGKTYHNIGIITGVVWNPGHWLKNPGWVYTVFLVRCNSYAHHTGLDVEVEERVIRPVRLAGGVKHHGN